MRTIFSLSGVASAAGSGSGATPVVMSWTVICAPFTAPGYMRECESKPL